MASKNKIATGALSAVAALALVGAWWQAPVRAVHHSVASAPVTSTEALTVVPAAVHPAWQNSVNSIYGQAPLIAGGVVLHAQEDGISGINPATGEVAWSYTRSDRTLCSLGIIGENAVASFAPTEGGTENSTNAGDNGCSETVSLAANDGQYKYQRSGVNARNVARLAPIASDVTFLGTIAPSRMELWRSDLVRTVEIGTVEAPQEAGYQPTANCTIRSAAVGSSKLFTLQECPVDAQIAQDAAIISSNDGATQVAGSTTAQRHLVVTFSAVAPTDARRPDFTAMGVVSESTATAAQLIAANDTNALMFVQGATPQLVVYNSKGKVIAQYKTTQPSALATGSPSLNGNGTFTADTDTTASTTFWWNGESLLAFDAQTFAPRYTVPDALGTGTMVGDQYVVPTTTGWSVIDPTSGNVTSTVAVDRGSDTVTHSALRLAGNTLVELQTTAAGSQVVGYQAV